MLFSHQAAPGTAHWQAFQPTPAPLQQPAVNAPLMYFPGSSVPHGAVPGLPLPIASHDLMAVSGNTWAAPLPSTLPQPPAGTQPAYPPYPTTGVPPPPQSALMPYHAIPAAHHAAPWPVATFANAKPSTTPNPSAADTRARGPPVDRTRQCRHFYLGSCERRRCRFSHDPTAPPPLEFDATRDKLVTSTTSVNSGTSSAGSSTAA